MPINLNSIFSIKAQNSEQLREWLNHQDSLTEKLIKITGDAQLELLSQKWVSTDWWDKNFLNIQDKKVFQREIIMKSHDIIYWYARSIIPKRCYEIDPIFFDRLKNESIKNLIFGNQSITRVNGIFYPINSQCLEFHWVNNRIKLIEEIIWVRLAEYSIHNKQSFYLVEIMLPDLENMKQ